MSAAETIRAQRRDDPEWQQKRAERAIAAKYIGAFEWRLVFEAVWGVGGWVAMIVLAMQGVVPYWLAMLVNGVLVYTLYMPAHEATHNNIQGRHWELRWVNDWVGRLSAIPIMLPWRAHQISHMRHHAFTNEPDRDPDHAMQGSFLRLPRFLLKLSTGLLVVPILGWRKDFVQRMAPGDKRRFAVVDDQLNEEIISTRLVATIQLVVMLGLSLLGYFWEVLFLYYLPSRIGLLLIMFFFAWFPHHPANERGRYRDTRATLFPASGILMRGHDRHIIHHMLPLVPHYKIPPLFDELRPMLEERGVRIEGPGAGPNAPPVLMHEPR